MEWLMPWSPIDDPEDASGWENELVRELSAGHPLFGLPVRAIATGDTDDVLYALEDGTERVAVVHLTWTYHPPESPPFPSTAIYSDFQTWVDQSMRPTHDERLTTDHLGNTILRRVLFVLME